MGEGKKQSGTRRGISLVETSAAVMIMGVCLAATTSAVYVVTRGADASVAASEANNQAGLVLQRMRDEMGLATGVAELTSSAVTFTHPDISGDSTDETIRYAWSGAAGDPLTRTLNGATYSILESCENFSMAAGLIDPVEELSVPKTDVIQVAAHDTYLVAFTARNANISTTNWYGELFIPNYAGAQTCTITSVWLRVRKSTAGAPSGDFKVSIQRVVNGTVNPDGVPIQEVVVRAVDLPVAYTYVEFPFSSVTINNGESVVVVARGTAAYTGEVSYNDTVSINVADGGQMLRYTTNAGTNWYPTLFQQTKDLRFYAYGYFTLSNPAPTGKYADGLVGSLYVHVERPLSPGKAVTDTAVMCLNRPRIAGLEVDDVPLR